MAGALASQKMSLVKFRKLQHQVEAAQKKAKKIREIADEKVQHLVRSSEVGMAGFSIGLARGKFGKKEISGVPMEILAAGAFHGMALIGVGGEMKDHLHAFGDGALAVAAADLGEIVGKKGFAGMREAFSPASAQGMLGGQRLTEEELETLRRS